MLHAITGRVVDEYLAVTNACETDIDLMEPLVFAPSNDVGVEQMYLMRREILELRRAVARSRRRCIGRWRAPLPSSSAARRDRRGAIPRPLSGDHRDARVLRGQQGVQRLPPLAQRLSTDFTTDPRFDSPRAVQLRLPAFDLSRLAELGRAVRDLYAGVARDARRISSVVDDAYVADLASAVTGGLGGRVGVAPRLFLRKLVADVLDRVDERPDFDPRIHYALTVTSAELDEVERNAAAINAGNIELELP